MEYYVPMHLLVTTHTTSSDLICEVNGGCGIDPLTAILSVAVGGAVLFIWWRERTLHR